MTWSGINARHPEQWILEILPVLFGLFISLKLRHRFPFSPFLLKLLTFFAILHLIGAHYSFSEVPFGNWLRDTFFLQRNHFDRIVHFTQGVTSVILFREIFIRTLIIPPGNILSALAVSCALAFSATYELLEFLAWKLILLRHTQTNILGAQGDIWDTQWDMFLALIGAIVVVLTLTRVHDNSINLLKTDRCLV
ncbi:MAG: hypothetical protein BWK76_15875 [Desulfobulbaceae bacterium A2]|nr:MAG: hypothetical protein BWK76_15875 [Desulfobulbaceae bacterium A2]